MPPSNNTTDDGEDAPTGEQGTPDESRKFGGGIGGNCGLANKGTGPAFAVDGTHKQVAFSIQKSGWWVRMIDVRYLCLVACVGLRPGTWRIEIASSMPTQTTWRSSSTKWASRARTSSTATPV